MYNFHSYGNFWPIPYSAVTHNIMTETNPVQKSLFDEILAEATKPEGFKAGRAIDLLSYTAPGDCADWIMAATGIPAMSPELGTTNKDTEVFRMKDKSLILDVMN